MELDHILDVGLSIFTFSLRFGFALVSSAGAGFDAGFGAGSPSNFPLSASAAACFGGGGPKGPNADALGVELEEKGSVRIKPIRTEKPIILPV